MSAWSQQRKLYIILTGVVIGAFGISATLFAIFYHPPSCDDGIQNGLEEGIDCGGSCTNFCAAPTKQLRDLWRRAFPIANGVYAAVAYVENQNESLFVPEVQFEIELYDVSSTLIGRISQVTPIMPNGITPIFVPHIVVGKQEVASASFRFVTEPVFEEQPYPYGFEIKDMHKNIEEDAAPYVRATVVNTGEKAVKEADFVVILYDKEGTAIAASRTFETKIQPREERLIQFSWINPLTLRKGECPGGQCKKEIERIEIIPIIRTW